MYLLTSPDDEEASEIASNGGYYAFIRWVASAAKKKNHRDLIQLINEGTCDSPAKAAAQIRALLKSSCPEQDTAEVGKTLADLLADLADGTPISIQ